MRNEINNPNKNIMEKKYDEEIHKNAINALIELFILNTELKKHIEESKIFKSECYLIKEDWFSIFKNYFSYDDICQILLKEKEQKNIEENKDLLVQKLINQFKSKIEEKIKANNEMPILDNGDNLSLEFKMNSDNTEMLFNNQYSIINSNILESLQEGFSDSFKSLKLIINNNKLLVKFPDKNSILIGSLNDDNNNLFIPEIILKYNTTNLLNKHFKEFEKNEFIGYEQILNTDKKVDDLKDKENNNLGKIFKIDKNKYMNINIKNNNNNDNKNNTDNNNINIINNNDDNNINDVNDKNIENILNIIYKNEEYFEQKLNDKENKEEKKLENYYIINSKYINKLKELLKYDDIRSKSKSNINNNDTLKNIDINLIKKELLIKEYFEIQKIPFKIEEKLEIKYYLNFALISKDLNDILIKNELISDKQEIIEIECLFNDNKILIHSLSQNDNCIFIYSKNKEKREFIIESLIYIEEKEKINHYINYLKQKGINIYLKELNLKDNKCDILDENKNKIGLFYQLINNNIKNDKVDNNIKIREEILILIKIYLYNKNLYEKIIASKNLDNSIFNQKNYNDKCYLINQEYITKYKEHYSYDKIKKYLDDNINTIDKDDINNIYEKMAKEEFFKDIEKKEKLGIKNIKKEGIDFIDEKNKIKYKNNFIIVNEEIYKLIIKNKDNNDENAEYIIKV